MGMGKMIVEFRSEAISTMVWSWRSSRTSPGYDRGRKTLTGDRIRPAKPRLSWQQSLDGRTKQSARDSGAGT